MKKVFIFGLIIIVLFILSIACNGKTQEKSENEQMEEQYKEERNQMVNQQIKRRGVKDSLVLEAMRDVPRHKFVPERVQNRAYNDSPLPIGYGQTISQPYIVAFMTETLELSGDEKVLEIGTGSGYQAAVLGEIVDSVYTIEIICALTHRAEKTLDTLGYDNITLKCADGYQGWEEHAPFDAIIVTAAPNHIPQPLVQQLTFGGKMIIPVGDLWQNLILVTKKEEGIEKKKVLPVRFVPMTGEAQDEDKE